MTKLFDVIYKNCEEIRMGSPFNCCEIELPEVIKIGLEKDGWQDKHCWSNDYNYLALVKWDTENNTPGFRFVLLDVRNNRKTITERIMGCCIKVEYEDNSFVYESTNKTKGKIVIEDYFK